MLPLFSALVKFYSTNRLFLYFVLLVVYSFVVCFKLSSVYVLAHSGFLIRCCPMADSQLIKTFRSLSDVSYSNECRTKKTFKYA